MNCIVDDWLATVLGYVRYVISYSIWFIQDDIMTHEKEVSSFESTGSGLMNAAHLADTFSMFAYFFESSSEKYPLVI